MWCFRGDYSQTKAVISTKFQWKKTAYFTVDARLNTLSPYREQFLSLSSEVFHHYLIQRRFKFPCQCVLQVTDNSWELHAQLSAVLCVCVSVYCAAVSFLKPESTHPVYYCYCCSPPSLCRPLWVCVSEGVLWECVYVRRGSEVLLFATVTPAVPTLNIQQLSSMAPECTSNYRSFQSDSLYLHIPAHRSRLYLYVYMCECVSVCVGERQMC